MKRSLTSLALALACTGAPAAPQAHHEHGIARLDAVLDGGELSLMLRAPLDSLLGFEHVPRSAAQRRAAEALVARLRGTPPPLRPDPAAGCERTEVALVSAALGLGDAAGGAAGHDDLEANYRFRCKAPGQLGHIELGLLQAYPRIERLEVQIVGPRGQSKQVLERGAQRLAWPQ